MCRPAAAHQRAIRAPACLSRIQAGVFCLGLVFRLDNRASLAPWVAEEQALLHVQQGHCWWLQ